jgi:diguanylate cyclase (GGDEF)-like protein
MTAPIRRYLPFLYSSLLVVTLTGLFLKLRYDLEVNVEVKHVHGLLDGLSGGLTDQLEHGAQYLSAGSRSPTSPAWTVSHYSTTDGYIGAVGEPRPIADSTLRRALLDVSAPLGTPSLLGPFATDHADNLMAVVQAGRDASGATTWTVVSASVELIIGRLNIAEIMKQGYRVQLADLGSSTPIYQSDPGELDAPIAENARFGATRLQWRAAPRVGWRAPPRFLTSALFVIMAVLLWLSYEFRRGRLLRAATIDLQEADQRRRDANVLYGKALESVANLESRLQVVSMYDSVTGLANLASMEHRIEMTLDTMRQSPHGVLCVLAIGFDHVNHITRSFGTEFTSRVLVIAAERVEFVLPSKDMLFRVGEFQLGIVLSHVTPELAIELSESIIREIESPISLDGHNFMLHPRIGIAQTESGYDEATTLIDRANTALDTVRRDAVSRYCLFDSSTSKESATRLQLESDLNRAFEEQQFEMLYEPIVLPVTNHVAGFEALIHWRHPTEGLIPPARFLPIAFQAGMSQQLNTWVVRAAARQAATWRGTAHSHLFINVKLSAEAFLRSTLVDDLGDALAEFGVPGNGMILELTESTLIQDVSGASRTLKRLAELEIGTWLGNFGTGYSSLSYLRALPLKGVKIDRSFIERTVTDARDFGFLKSLIDLLSYLGMQSIADGVMTKEQYELLSLTTCDLFQGEFFARGMSERQIDQWISEKRGSVRSGGGA